MKQLYAFLLLFTSASVHSMIPNEQEGLRNKFIRRLDKNAQEAGYTFDKKELSNITWQFFNGSDVKLGSVLKHQNPEMLQPTSLLTLYGNTVCSLTTEERNKIGFPKDTNNE